MVWTSPTGDWPAGRPRGLDVPEGHREAGHADVGQMHPGPIVQPSRRPAPPEGPPVAHAPGMVPLPLTPDGQRLAVNGDGAVGGAGDLVSSGEVVVIGRAVGGPGQIEVEVRRPAAAPGVDLSGIFEHLSGRGGGDAELLERLHDVELDPDGRVLGHQTGTGGHRRVVADRTDARSAGADDPCRPPGHSTIRIEPQSEPPAPAAVLVHEVGVVRLVPQVLGVGWMTLFVVGGDDVRRRHRCMAEAPGGPGTSTTGSGRSSNSVRSARDMTACWK